MKIQYKSSGAATFLVHTALCTISKVRGYKVGGAAGFLLIFDRKTPPANAATNFKACIPIFNDAPYGDSFLQEELELKVGCYIVSSSSSVQYTALAENVEIEVLGESPWDNTGLSVSGDYTTGISDKDLSADTNLRLYRLEFTALAAFGAVLYAKVFGRPPGSVAIGDVPLLDIELPNNTSVDKFFNQTDIKDRVAGVLYTGLYIILDENPGPIAGTYGGNTHFAVKISYTAD